MKPISPASALIYDYMERHLSEHGITPTLRKIKIGLGMASTSGVNYHIGQLSKAGWIERPFRTARTIRLLKQPRVFYVKAAK